VARVGGTEAREHEASGGAENTDDGETMEGGRLTNKAGMLLKNLGNGEAMCIICHRQAQPQAAPVEGGGAAEKSSKRRNKAII